MSNPPSSLTPDEKLGQLRQSIDRIDQAMHDLLIERSGIIDELIQVKGEQGGGSAFRPGREAQMMRHLAGHHRGLLPFDAIEGIWRVIISTFTYVQANYKVFAQADDVLIRDSVRFHFGFTVPCLTCAEASAVIAGVQASEGDLGVLPLAPTITQPWWDDLRGLDRPKIIARLPFVERANHPAGLPVCVIARPLVAAAVRDVTLYAVQSQARLRTSHGLSILCDQTITTGWSSLIEVPGETDATHVKAQLAAAGAEVLALEAVGSHAARFQI